MKKSNPKLPGSMGVLLKMDQEMEAKKEEGERKYKDKQAPIARIEGLDMSSLALPTGPDDSTPTPNAITKSPPATSKPKVKRSSTVRDYSTKPADDKFVTRLIASENIKPWKYADRPESEFGDWDEFVRSIASKGVEIPIIVRAIAKGQFEVIAGRRRWRACLELGIDVPCQVRDISDSEAASLQHLENNDRSGISAWAKAKSWNAYIENGVFKSQSALAVAMGVDRRIVSDSMAYVRLPEILEKAIGPMTNVGIKMIKLLTRLSSDERNIERLCEISGLIRDNKISVAKVTSHCRTGTTKLEVKTYKANGVNCFSMRNDSNGTPVISLRKELLEHVSVEECLNELIKLAEGKVK